MVRPVTITVDFNFAPDGHEMARDADVFPPTVLVPGDTVVATDGDDSWPAIVITAEDDVLSLQIRR